jgi:hypothetical protein
VIEARLGGSAAEARESGKRHHETPEHVSLLLAINSCARGHQTKSGATCPRSDGSPMLRSLCGRRTPFGRRVLAEHGDGEQQVDRSGLKVGLGLGEDMLEAPARGSCPPDRARLDERRAGVAA